MSRNEQALLYTQLIEEYEGILGKQVADILIEDYHHNEARLSFQAFLRNLEDAELDLDEAAKARIRRVADFLGMSNDPSGKGIYW